MPIAPMLATYSVVAVSKAVMSPATYAAFASPESHLNGPCPTTVV